MSSKDENTFSNTALMSTKSGRLIIKQALLQEKGYKMYNKYKKLYEKEFPEFTKRYLLSLHEQIISDPNPAISIKKFVEEIGSPELGLDDSQIQSVRSRLSKPEILADRVERILDSNFIKMTFPVLYALFDGATEYIKSPFQKM